MVKLNDILKDRYGNMALPFVVAVQVVNEFRIDKVNVMNGLLGQETVFGGRVPNGAWISDEGPTGTRTSVESWFGQRLIRGISRL